jgi:chromosome segregation ATPase
MQTMTVFGEADGIWLPARKTRRAAMDEEYSDAIGNLMCSWWHKEKGQLESDVQELKDGMRNLNKLSGVQPQNKHTLLDSDEATIAGLTSTNKKLSKQIEELTSELRDIIKTHENEFAPIQKLIRDCEFKNAALVQELQAMKNEYDRLQTAYLKCIAQRT